MSKNIDREDALDCALSGKSYGQLLIDSVCAELNVQAYELKVSHTVNGRWPESEMGVAAKFDHLKRMAGQLRKMELVPISQLQPPTAIDWKAVHDMADEYVAGYEFRGDEGDYHPNDQERFLIEDCVAGLMHEVQELVTAKQKEREGA